MTSMDLTLAEVADALQAIDPHSRDTWIRMAMAIKAEFGDGGFEVWNDWSASAQNYNAREARTQWRSIKETGGVGLGSLIHEAKSAGWQPPQRERTPAERQQWEEQRRKRQQERRAAEAAAAEREAQWQERIAGLAAECWEQLGQVGQSKYLGAKRVRAHGVRFAKRGMLLVVDDEAERAELITDRHAIREWLNNRPADREGFSFRYLRRGTLVVPMRGVDRRVWNLQLIFAGGAKKFLRNGRKRGTFHFIGTRSADDEPLVFVEGYATGASVHEATGWPVVVCWDAGNLSPVAEAIRAQYPDWPFVFAGDDDHESTDAQGNPVNDGRNKACRAAGRSGGITVFPQFEDPAGKSDWNDLHVAQGLAAVREQLHAAVAAGGDGVGDAGPPDDDEPPLPEPPPEDGGGASTDRPASLWEELLVTTDKGAVKATLHNLITVLENHPDWRGVFALDAFANEIRKVRQPPYHSRPEPIADVDGTEIAAWFGHPHNYGLSVGSGMALEAVEAVATRRAYHPVIEYLDGLEWDGTPRLDRMLADHFGAHHDDYAAAVGRNWLMSAVARVRSPGCKVDFMVILEGEQGRGKSTAVRVLCGAEWFAEMLESPQNKDFFQILAGRWMIEIPELQAFNKSDRNKIKAAVSAQEDTYRPSYGRYARQFKRQNIFVGTTNDDAYLKDETGARRFLPVRCGHIDLQALQQARDQLWAEADARFARGESWWQFPEQASAEQDARYDADAWEDPIIEWLDGRCGEARYADFDWAVTPDNPVDVVTIGQVMRFALDVETAKQSKPDQMRVGAVLRRLGWRRRQVRLHGRRQYAYVRPVPRQEAA